MSEVKQRYDLDDIIPELDLLREELAGKIADENIRKNVNEGMTNVITKLRNIEPATNEDSFNRGAKAMFDYFQYRVANRYHGDPEVNKAIQEENKVLLEFIQDALESVDPAQYIDWVSLDEMYERGRQQGLAEGKTK